MNSAIHTLQPQADRRTILTAYRHLLRQGLKVVNFATPNRHVLRDVLRSSFRNSPTKEFDSRKIENTLRFLARATDMAGVEHKLVKNLLMVRFWEQPEVHKDMRILRLLGLDHKEIAIRRGAMEQFNLTLMLLNESLGTCLR